MTTASAWPPVHCVPCLSWLIHFTLLESGLHGQKKWKDISHFVNSNSNYANGTNHCFTYACFHGSSHEFSCSLWVSSAGWLCSFTINTVWSCWYLGFPNIIKVLSLSKEQPVSLALKWSEASQFIFCIRKSLQNMPLVILRSFLVFKSTMLWQIGTYKQNAVS